MALFLSTCFHIYRLRFIHLCLLFISLPSPPSLAVRQVHEPQAVLVRACCYYYYVWCRSNTEISLEVYTYREPPFLFPSHPPLLSLPPSFSTYLCSPRETTTQIASPLLVAHPLLLLLLLLAGAKENEQRLFLLLLLRPPLPLLGTRRKKGKGSGGGHQYYLQKGGREGGREGGKVAV